MEDSRDLEDLQVKFELLLHGIEQSQASRAIRRIKRLKRYGSKRVKVLIRKCPGWYLPSGVIDHLSVQRWARVLLSERKRA